MDEQIAGSVSTRTLSIPNSIYSRFYIAYAQTTNVISFLHATQALLVRIVQMCTRLLRRKNERPAAISIAGRNTRDMWDVRATGNYRIRDQSCVLSILRRPSGVAVDTVDICHRPDRRGAPP